MTDPRVAQGGELPSVYHRHRANILKYSQDEPSSVLQTLLDLVFGLYVAIDAKKCVSQEQTGSIGGLTSKMMTLVDKMEAVHNALKSLQSSQYPNSAATPNQSTLVAGQV